jgi:PIN domain
MNKQTIKNKQYTALKAERLAEAKIKLLDGSIGAISVDTCIFTEAGYHLDSGTLKHLEQFKGNAFRLVFSEITFREIHGHITKDSYEAKVKLVSALRGIKKYWPVQTDKPVLDVDELLGSDSAKEMTSKKLSDFITRCGGQLIKAQSNLDISELLERYFNVHSPFESSADKKSEFPDAIALLSLQAWARDEGIAVLSVTKDNGCKSFCKGSEQLYAVDNLSDALTLIQERDTHCSELCRSLETKIAHGNYPDIDDKIENVISEEIWSIDWSPEADAFCYYDAELEEVELISAVFDGPQRCPEFKPVDYRNDMLVVKTSIELEVKASCGFSFFIKDAVDHDMVAIGSSFIGQKEIVNVDILLTFEKLSNDKPELVRIELIPTCLNIDFGTIEPDYGDENCSSEY